MKLKKFKVSTKWRNYLWLIFSALVALIVLILSMGIVAQINDTIMGSSNQRNSLLVLAGFMLSAWLAIRAYKRLTGQKRNKAKIDMVSLPNNHHNYLTKHWYGEHSLAKSYWINTFLLNIIIGLLFEQIFSRFNMDSNPQLGAIAIILSWIAIILIAVWQIVGVWRSARYYTKHTYKIWGKAAQVLMVFGTIGLISTVFNVMIPQVKEFTLIATGEDLLGDYQIRILNNATEIEFSGYIGFGAPQEVKKYLNNHPAIEIIHLNSEGGRVLTARKLAKLIEEKDLKTYTSRGCYSACVIPYAAGKERLIKGGANLGFHQYSFPGIKQSDFETDYSTDRQYLLSRNIDPDFLDIIFGTLSEDLWYPSHELLLESNYVTQYPRSGEVAISDITLADLEGLDAILSQSPLFMTIKKSDHDAYNEIFSAVKSAVERGQSFAEVRETTIPIIESMVHARLPQTSGEALADYVRYHTDAMKFLRQQNPLKCYAFENGFSFDSVEIPTDLYQRRRNVYANVIANYSTKIKVPNAGDVNPHLILMFSMLERKHGEHIDLLSKDKHTHEEKILFCDLSIDFYEIASNLGGEDSTKILRYIYSD